MKTQPFEKHVWAEIDLDALRHNFRAVKARAGDLPLCAVVKADSYGHGAVQCARVFAQEGAAWLAVSCLTEAVQLRQDGQTLPILILGHVQPEYAQTLIHEDITVACYSTEQAQNLSAAAVKAGGRVKIHLKADTGMGRIGFALRTDFDAAIREMLAVCELPGLEMTGLFQHFAVGRSGINLKNFCAVIANRRHDADFVLQLGIVMVRLAGDGSLNINAQANN